MQITEKEIKLLEFVKECWMDLTYLKEPKTYASMCDHCHCELEELETLIERMKEEITK